MKKIHRFLVTQPPFGPSIIIEDTDLVHLIKNVLKLNVGEKCIVFSDGGSDYLSTIEVIEKKSITLNIESIIPKKNIPKKITACISITKRDNFELVVQKLTEIGIKTIVPIISEHTIKQSIRIDRLQKISDEALEQSGGSSRVNISEPETLLISLEKRKDLSQYYFDMGGGKLSSVSEKELVFYIGPEGGWSEEDNTLFKEHGVKTCSLGETVLRAETAAIIASYKLIWD